MRVENSIGMNDYMTGTLKSIIRTMNTMVSNMQILDQSVKVVGSGGFDAMNRGVAAAEINLQHLEAMLGAVELAQHRAASAASSWGKKLADVRGFVSPIAAALDELGRGMTFTEGYTNANAQLGLINDGLRTQKELQDDVAAAAMRSRSSYGTTADFVNRISASGAMRDTSQAIDFAEEVNKLLAIGGGGGHQNEAAMLQLSRALASGQLQGAGYQSLEENAPVLLGTISDGMNVPMNQLKEMSSAGQLTAEAVINAVEKMGGEINSRFAEVPVTFSQNMQTLKDIFGRAMSDMAEDGGLKMINDLFAQLNLWLLSDNGQTFMQGLSDGIYMVGYALELAVGGVQRLLEWFSCLGDAGNAILFGIIVMAAIFAAQALWSVVAPLGAIAAGFATIYFPIILISALIGGLIALFLHLGVSASEILSFIGGLFGSLIAVVLNIIIFFINLFLAVQTFLANVFVDPIYAIKKLFYDLVGQVIEFISGLVNGIIDGLNWIAGMANKVLGTDFGGDIKHWNPENPLKEPERDQRGITDYGSYDYVDYSKFAGAGANLASGFLNQAQDFDFTKSPGSAANYGVPNIGEVGSVGKVGKIDKDVNIAKEDLKYMLDAVTQKNVNQINMTVQMESPVIQSSGTVREEADIGKVADTIAETLVERTAVSAAL